MATPESVVFELAGCRLRIAGLPFADAEFLDRHYPGFHALGDPRPADLELAAEPSRPRLLLALPGPGSPPRVDVESTGERLVTRSHGHEAELDFARGRGWVRFAATGAVASRVALENLLRVAFANLLIRREACLVHAAGVLDGKYARVFFGLSGSGKSRLARRSVPRPLLSDDLVALVVGDGLFAERVPFFGEFPPEERSPGRYPVRSLDALGTGPPGLRALPRSLQIARLAACLPFLDPGEPRRLPLARRILELVPARELSPGAGDAFWELLASP